MTEEKAKYETADQEHEDSLRDVVLSEDQYSKLLVAYHIMSDTEDVFYSMLNGLFEQGKYAYIHNLITIRLDHAEIVNDLIMLLTTAYIENRFDGEKWLL